MTVLIVAGSYDEMEALRGFFPSCAVVTIWDTPTEHRYKAAFITANVDVGSPAFGANVVSRIEAGGEMFRITPALRVPHASN